MVDRTVMDFDLPKLQQRQLRLAQLVRTVCEKHGIHYFLIAGTLLGAVRHQGFIPWDDDLDIGMLRSDYDRFIKVAQQELGPECFVQTYDTDADMPLPYAKVRLNGTLLREAGSRNCKWHSGIFIDVFPFDGVPENRSARYLHKWLMWLLGRMLIVKCGFSPLASGGSLLKRVLYLFCIYPISSVVPKGWQVKLFDLTARRYPSDASRYVCATGGSYGYDRETIERIWVADAVFLDFCEGRFKCPAHWREYLENLYGDYMKLPPAEQRFNRHGIVELDFGRE